MARNKLDDHLVTHKNADDCLAVGLQDDYERLLSLCRDIDLVRKALNFWSSSDKEEATLRAKEYRKLEWLLEAELREEIADPG